VKPCGRTWEASAGDQGGWRACAVMPNVSVHDLGNYRRAVNGMSNRNAGGRGAKSDRYRPIFESVGACVVDKSVPVKLVSSTVTGAAMLTASKNAGWRVTLHGDLTSQVGSSAR